eukprot:6490314-Amphidinium_carterae.1
MGRTHITKIVTSVLFELAHIQSLVHIVVHDPLGITHKVLIVVPQVSRVPLFIVVGVTRVALSASRVAPRLLILLNKDELIVVRSDYILVNMHELIVEGHPGLSLALD